MELNLLAGLLVAATPFTPPARTGSVNSNKRILIVEDDYLVSSELKHSLSEAGYEVVAVAISAGEAIELAHVHEPDLIIMDIRLQGNRDGIDAAVEIFTRFGIRSIFATAHADAQTIERARPAFPFGWIQKPFSVKSLIKLIAQN